MKKNIKEKQRSVNEEKCAKLFNYDDLGDYWVCLTRRVFYFDSYDFLFG